MLRHTSDSAHFSSAMHAASSSRQLLSRHLPDSTWRESRRSRASAPAGERETAAAAATAATPEASLRVQLFDASASASASEAEAREDDPSGRA